jgi:hypothetical protein
LLAHIMMSARAVIRGMLIIQELVQATIEIDHVG